MVRMRQDASRQSGAAQRGGGGLVVKRIAWAVLGVVLVATASTWWLVSTGHWPFNEKGLPARGVLALNRAAGLWLVDHGMPSEDDLKHRFQ
jgi:hypothetical protein